jgi:hypothetical protein
MFDDEVFPAASHTKGIRRRQIAHGNLSRVSAGRDHHGIISLAE